MLKNTFNFLTLLGFLFCGSTLNTIAQEELLIDFNKDPNIRTIQLHPIKNEVVQEAQPAVIKLNGTEELLLRFDVIDGNFDNYKAKITHCTHDWKPSSISSIDFLQGYNEFRIEDFEESFNTITNYIHYSLILPKTRISGNYILTVYKEGEENDFVFKRRFMVFESKVLISPTLEKAFANESGQVAQRVLFNVSYKGYAMQNPAQTTRAYVRQNMDWKYLNYYQHPQFIRDFQQELQYTSLEQKYTFMAGNEFRIFDIRSVFAPGRFVDQIERKNDIVEAWLSPIKNNDGIAYTDERDLDGQYVIATGNEYDPDLEGDYFKANFFFYSPEKLKEKIRIDGLFTKGLKPELFDLKYDQNNQMYKGSVILKQGFYNYRIIQPLKRSHLFQLEGSHFETNNTYEFIIYNRERADRYDRIVGYYRITSREI